MKSYNPKRRKMVTSSGDVAYFYTCARPGRLKGKGPVSDEEVSAWVYRLPGPHTAIVSLLGRKQGPDGESEFSYYSFCGGFDTISEREGQPTFQEWLNKHHPALGILVKEHPTYDCRPVLYEQLDQIEADVRDLVSRGRAAVVVDSGGATRTGQVRRRITKQRIFH